MADWKTAARERVKQMSEGNRLSLVVGDNCLRVMPDKKDLLPDGRLGPKGIQHKPVREFKIHYGVGPDKTTLGCGHDIDGGGSCWGCDVAIPSLEKKGKRDYVKQITAKDCFVVNASVYNPDTQRFSPAKPWWPSVGGGNSLAVRVYGRIVGSKKDYLDPVKGHNLTVTKTGEGINTRYPNIEGDDSPTPVPRSILAAMKDLDTIVPKYDEETWKDTFYGRTPKSEMEEDLEDTEEGTEETGNEEGEYEEAAEGEAEVDPDAAEEEYEPAPDADPDAPEEYEAEPEAEIDPDAPEEYEPEPEPEPEPPKRAPAPAKKQAPPAAKKAPVPAAKKTAPPARRK